MNARQVCLAVIKKKTIDSSMVGQIVDLDAIPGADHLVILVLECLNK